ncbi:MAG: FecR family protein [Pseudomonadota bacterium]
MTARQVVVDQAADWLMKTEDRSLTPQETDELQRWRAAHPEHEQAWQAALQLRGMIDQVSTDFGRRVLGRSRVDRRNVLKSLLLVAAGYPVANGVWNAAPAWTADYRTGVGEQLSVPFVDGTILRLNTATAVNVVVGERMRHVQLVEGEILLTTGSNAARPLLVSTPQGTIRPMGTSFSVRTLDQDRVFVSVFEDSVSLAPAQSVGSVVVQAGESVTFDARETIVSSTHAERSPAWARGQLVSDNQRLDEFLGELQRYRPGVLRCDPAVADLRISGVFQLNDTDQILGIVGTTLPVSIQRITDYWVTVSAP